MTTESPPEPINSSTAPCESGCRTEQIKTNGNRNYTQSDAEVKPGPLSRSRIITVDRMLGFNRNEDPNSVYGLRWLCRGKQFGLQAPTGVGKSALVMGWAIASCLGETVFDVEGMAPREQLRVLIIQAKMMKVI
jgi:hypothetical protein